MKFVADKMLGKLAKWLRILGFDTLYLDHPSLPEIMERVAEGRIFLTRNRKVFQHVPGAVFISSDDWKAQLEELVERGCVEAGEARWFTRCILCNELLIGVSKEEVDRSVPEYIRQTAPSFARCPLCGKIYWPGSHLARMKERIGRLALEKGAHSGAPVNDSRRPGKSKD